MKKLLGYIAPVLALIAFLLILSVSSLVGQSDKTKKPAKTHSVNAGAFTVRVPADWTPFAANEAAELRRQYAQQSDDIYSQFSGAPGQAKTVDVLAFHISKGTGSFFLVSLTVPPTSNLISLLKSQVDDKMAFGVREGYIRKYLGLVSVDNDRLAGFYAKAIGSSGGVELAGGFEHNNLKNTVIQLTLLSPIDWDETKAINALSFILDSMTLRKK